MTLNQSGLLELAQMLRTGWWRSDAYVFRAVTYCKARLNGRVVS